MKGKYEKIGLLSIVGVTLFIVAALAWAIMAGQITILEVITKVIFAVVFTYVVLYVFMPALPFVAYKFADFFSSS